MGYKFSLVLSREISDEESEILKNAGCAAAVFATDSLPTNADVIVTKMDFDDTVSPSLAEAIESALEAVKNVPDLSVPGLTVPAQPAQAPAEDPDAVIEGVVVEDAVVDEKPAAKARTRRTTAKKASARKAANGDGASAQDGSASADDATDPAGVAAGSG